MKTLKEYFLQAKEEKWAIGHFNFSTADQLKAIVEAAKDLESPVMVATSEGEAGFFGREQAVALVKSYQAEGQAVFLNADHHKTEESAKQAIDVGYDTVLIDASRMPYEDNIRSTLQVVQYARDISTSRHLDISVEGELGYLKGESQVQEEVEISPADFTKPEEAKDFVERTGVDRLAIVFGNIHGIVTKQEEKLDMAVLQAVAAAVPNTFLVLHGASGLPDNQIRAAIENGITNVHINTELRLAYHDALEAELQKEPDQTTPYKFLAPSFEAMKELVKKKLELFGSVGKI
ncbi:MAG: tagatose 1,6-diphosphate aldolase [Parcubacteria group bacterium Gr01-1014_44]|nr:MAG: tagatose 1,6-diphosphate aldolase [Parcubacteria group bacterium Gr01-1014_44]